MEKEFAEKSSLYGIRETLLENAKKERDKLIDDATIVKTSMDKLNTQLQEKEQILGTTLTEKNKILTQKSAQKQDYETQIQKLRANIQLLEKNLGDMDLKMRHIKEFFGGNKIDDMHSMLQELKLKVEHLEHQNSLATT